LGLLDVAVASAVVAGSAVACQRLRFQPVAISISVSVVVWLGFLTDAAACRVAGRRSSSAVAVAIAVAIAASPWLREGDFSKVVVTVVAELSWWQLVVDVGCRLVGQGGAGWVVRGGGGCGADAVTLADWFVARWTAAHVGAASVRWRAAKQARMVTTGVAILTGERINVKVHVSITFTVKAARHVDTVGIIAAHVSSSALVVINTFSIPLSVPSWTFTSKAALHVVTFTISTFAVSAFI